MRIRKGAYFIVMVVALLYASLVLCPAIMRVALNTHIDMSKDPALNRAVAAGMMFVFGIRQLVYTLLMYPVRVAFDMKLRENRTPSECIRIARAYPEFELEHEMQIAE